MNKRANISSLSLKPHRKQMFQTKHPESCGVSMQGLSLLTAARLHFVYSPLV